MYGKSIDISFALGTDYMYTWEKSHPSLPYVASLCETEI